MNYYNEIDPFVVAWLRELIKAGHVAQGEVDERDIQDIVPSDLRGFKQCHFFAGIGVWSYALRLAGWPDDRPVWTGSCPCQPFSAAGKRGGTADERHTVKTYAPIFVLAMLLGCGGGQGTAPVAKVPAPTPPPAPPCTSCQVPPPCPPIKVGPIWASDPVTGATIVPTSVDADGTPHYTFTAGQQVQFHAPVTGGC